MCIRDSIFGDNVLAVFDTSGALLAPSSQFEQTITLPDGEYFLGVGLGADEGLSSGSNFDDGFVNAASTDPFTSNHIISLEINGASVIGNPVGGNFPGFENVNTQYFRFEVGSSLLLGDVNMDGVVNFLDISPFIGLLSTQQFQSEADINEDSVINFLDISPFIILLSS